MSNIQSVVTKRHDWQDNRLHNPLHPQADRRGFVMALICMNCRKPWYPEMQGSPPLAGCLSDIQVRRVGTERQKDYLEQEMRFRAEQERVDPRDLEGIRFDREPVPVSDVCTESQPQEA